MYELVCICLDLVQFCREPSLLEAEPLLVVLICKQLLLVSPARLLQDGCWRARSRRSVWEETSLHPLLCLHRPRKDQSAVKAAKVSYSEAGLGCQRSVLHFEQLTHSGVSTAVDIPVWLGMKLMRLCQFYIFAHGAFLPSTICLSDLRSALFLFVTEPFQQEKTPIKYWCVISGTSSCVADIVRSVPSFIWTVYQCNHAANYISSKAAFCQILPSYIKPF